jgi:hypothetical protein
VDFLRKAGDYPDDLPAHGLQLGDFLGVMGAFNLEFNIHNIIISTFIFGLGTTSVFSSWTDCW